MIECSAISSLVSVSCVFYTFIPTSCVRSGSVVQYCGSVTISWVLARVTHWCTSCTLLHNSFPVQFIVIAWQLPYLCFNPLTYWDWLLIATACCTDYFCRQQEWSYRQGSRSHNSKDISLHSRRTYLSWRLLLRTQITLTSFSHN